VVKHKEVHGSNVAIWFKTQKGAKIGPAPDFSNMDPHPKWTERLAYAALHDGWDNEAGYFLKRPEQDERVRDLAFLRYYGAQSWLARNSKRRKNTRIQGMGWFSQKRESRRLVGDVILREQDYWCVEGTGKRAGQGWFAKAKPHPDARTFEDGVVTTTWHMDVHTSRKALGRREGWPKELWFKAGGQLRDKKKAKPYIGQCHIPYRAMYSKNVSNMFMIGRCVSASRLAFGALRITNTTSMMGIAIGRSAAVCRKHKCTPRESYEKHLEELKTVWAMNAKATSLPGP
jgi:hypothetical protein